MSSPSRARPDPRTAMYALIGEMRAEIPFATPASRLCQGPCKGCSKKLLEFLDTELSEWEARLDEGETPRLGDLQRLGKLGRKIRAVLVRNGLMESAEHA